MSTQGVKGIMSNHQDEVNRRLDDLENTRKEFRAMVSTIAGDLNSIKISIAVLAQRHMDTYIAGESPICKIQTEKIDGIIHKQSIMETTINKWAGGLALACLFMPVLTGIIIVHFTRK